MVISTSTLEFCILIEETPQKQYRGHNTPLYIGYHTDQGAGLVKY